MNVRHLQDQGANYVFSAIAAHAPETLGLDEHAQTAIAPRPPWRIALVELPRSTIALAMRSDEGRWFEWRDATVVEHPRAGARRELGPAPKRSGRWSEDARAFVDAILADVDKGPWLRWLSGPAPFDDVSIHVATVMGRHVDCDVVVLDRLLSKEHLSFDFKIAREASRRDLIFGAPHSEPTPQEMRHATSNVWIRDHRSLNGTHLRDARERSGSAGSRSTAEGQCEARIDGQRPVQDGDIYRAANTEFTVSMSRPPRWPRANDGAWRDDAVWSSLFLDALIVRDLDDAPPPPPEPLFARLGGLREGSRGWHRGGKAAHDTRWLLGSCDEAEVFFDALVERGAPGLETVPAPLVGDACMRWTNRGEGPEDLVLVRVGRMVARLYVRTAWFGWSIDDLAARVVTRVAASRLG